MAVRLGVPRGIRCLVIVAVWALFAVNQLYGYGRMASDLVPNKSFIQILSEKLVLEKTLEVQVAR